MILDRGAGYDYRMDVPRPDLLRRLLAWLVVAGTAGLLAELALLEHFEDPWQWAPVALLGAGLPLGLVVAVRPHRAALGLFRGLMVLYLLAGAVGVLLHYRGNAEFELERRPELGGLALAWQAMRGATPALAPGALAQLGLLGLLLTVRHPALAPRTERT